jgi:FkbM family methyltransferase
MTYTSLVENRSVDIFGESDWTWVKTDNGAFDGPKNDWAQHRDKYFMNIKNTRVCVTAGGNCGMYTRFYSKIFDVVYVFEPDALNFFCLVNNNQTDNTIKINAALGAQAGFTSLKRVTMNNVGMHKLDGQGFIPIMTIDNMNLPVLDFLQLDVEGYEEHALKGAENTIARCRPIIVVEGNKADGILSSFGYRFSERSGHADRVWVPE